MILFRRCRFFLAGFPARFKERVTSQLFLTCNPSDAHPESVSRCQIFFPLEHTVRSHFSLPFAFLPQANLKFAPFAWLLQALSSVSCCVISFGAG
jgi:hypothetical protein